MGVWVLEVHVTPDSPALQLKGKYGKWPKVWDVLMCVFVHVFVHMYICMCVYICACICICIAVCIYSIKWKIYKVVLFTIRSVNSR